MFNARRRTIDLLSSISGILIFLSVAHYVDLNGWGKFGLIIAAVGVWLLFWPEMVMKWTEKVSFIQRPVILTVSHVLIFIGLKTYLQQYVTNYAWILAVIGILFLNYNRKIAKLLFPREEEHAP